MFGWEAWILIWLPIYIIIEQCSDQPAIGAGVYDQDSPVRLQTKIGYGYESSSNLFEMGFRLEGPTNSFLDPLQLYLLFLHGDTSFTLSIVN